MSQLRETAVLPAALSPAGLRLGAARLVSWIFWSWNVIFLIFATFGLGPTVLVHLIGGAVRGEVAPDFAVIASLLALTPPIAIILAVRRAKGRPLALLRLFYGFEAMLMFLCIFRLFVFRELTPATMQLAVLAVLAVAAVLIHTLNPRLPQSRVGSGLRLAMHAGHALGTLYLGVLGLFFVPPAAFAVSELLLKLPASIWRELSYISLSQVFFAGVGIPLFAYSATLMLGLPLAAAVLGFIDVRSVAKAHSHRFGKLSTALVVFAVLGVNAAWFIYANRQPQAEAFSLLEKPATDSEDRARLLRQAPKLKEGLLNAYLASYRYLATEGEANGVTRMYTDLGMDTPKAEGVQAAFNSVARPFIYQGKNTFDDARKAEKAYESFFDEPIQKAERDRIVHALRSTYEGTSAEAGLLDRDAEIVLVEKQDVSVVESESGETAEVEIHEAYLNTKAAQQEVLYHFTMPEGAVITGLWLGDTEDRARRFPYAVAPKGAAQKVYRQELAARQDPALLEQVGPSSYRLRIFPIPSRFSRPENEVPRLHMWLTYRTLRDESGNWPLPRLVEKRNAFWKRGGDWLVPSIGATKPAPVATARRIAIPTETTPVAIDLAPRAKFDLAPLAGLRIAVVVDRSLSMRRHEKELAKALAAVEAQATAARFVAEYVLTGYDTKLLAAGNLPSFEDVRAFGSVAPMAALAQARDALRDKKIAALLFLTDDSGHERRDAPVAWVEDFPVFLVHVGDDAPEAYDDRLLEAMWRHRGGAVTGGGGVEEALSRIAAQRADPEVVGFDRRYVWREPRKAAAGAELVPELSALGAARLIRGRLAEPDARSSAKLALVHSLATKNSLVTPVSSMLVLVNDAQRARLAAAASAADAFETTPETGKEAMSTPFGGASVSATPEPEEWLLIVLAFGLMVYAYRRNPQLLRAHVRRGLF